MTLETYHGSCHCGSIEFETQLDLTEPTTRCNCSLCMKTRMWFAVAGSRAFKITKGEDALTEYQWIPPAQKDSFLHFLFCKTCGVRIYGWGDDPSFGGKFHAVALAALDDASADMLAASPIKYVDGRHDRFQHEPDDVRLLK